MFPFPSFSSIEATLSTVIPCNLSGRQRDQMMGLLLFRLIGNSGQLMSQDIQLALDSQRNGCLRNQSTLSDFRRVLRLEINRYTVPDDRIELEPEDYDRLLGMMVNELIISRCQGIPEDNLKWMFNRVLNERRRAVQV